MHRYTTSTNIERDVKNDIHYITTPNALDVYQRLIQGYQQDAAWRTSHHRVRYLKMLFLIKLNS